MVPWAVVVSSPSPKKNDEARALYISLGAAIGQMHTIGFSTCGEITSDGRVLAGTSYAAALRRRAQRRIANPAHVALFLSVLQEHHALFESLPAGVLCHEDLNPGNLLVPQRSGSLTLTARGPAVLNRTWHAWSSGAG